MKIVEGNIVDIHKREIYPGIVEIDEAGIISDIRRNDKSYNTYLCPGFIDAHVHIESSMLIPEEFSKIVLAKGTIAIVTDPHEIANVMGKTGIQFMIENSREADLKIYFTIPSCVPATPFDCAGCKITAKDVQELAETKKFIGLSEVMNVPGVLNKDPEMMEKIRIAHINQLVIDGHAPELRGNSLKEYIAAGISTDHECVSLEEAEEKLASGMKILIREGSAAKNYDTLKPLIKTHPDQVMFCTDDSHPGDLLGEGHIDKLVRHAIKDGFDLFDVLKIASLNPKIHYHLPVGTLKIGDFADFVRIENLKTFEVLSTYIQGYEKYSKEKKGLDQEKEVLYVVKKEINNFKREPICEKDIKKRIENQILSIEIKDGEIITSKKAFSCEETDNLESDIKRDLLKIVYLNRYHQKMPQIAYITGVGLKKGAFASSVSHDSHNIIAIGCRDKEIVKAINALIEEKGGLVVNNGGKIKKLPLPIAGIMSEHSVTQVAEKWNELIQELKKMGCKLSSPFMTLSFMSLIVIPELKIGEKGLFDFNEFRFMEEDILSSK